MIARSVSLQKVSECLDETVHTDEIRDSSSRKFVPKRASSGGSSSPSKKNPKDKKMKSKPTRPGPGGSTMHDSIDVVLPSGESETKTNSHQEKHHRHKTHHRRHHHKRGHNIDEASREGKQAAKNERPKTPKGSTITALEEGSSKKPLVVFQSTSLHNIGWNVFSPCSFWIPHFFHS